MLIVVRSRCGKETPFMTNMSIFISSGGSEIAGVRRKKHRLHNTSRDGYDRQNKKWESDR